MENGERRIPERGATLVAVERVADYGEQRVREAIRALLEPLGGMQAFVPPDGRVLLKPNYIRALPSKKAATTHPAVIAAVAQEVVDAGARPVVGDSPAFGSARGAAMKSGLLDLDGMGGVPIVELDRATRVRAAIPGPLGCFVLGYDPADFDVVISLPKLKIHSQLGVSMALKNPFGCVKGRRKALLHYLASKTDAKFHEMLIQCCATVAPALSILDGIVALGEYGPTGGEPKAIGLRRASRDAAALDRVACEAVGIEVADAPLIGAARAMGLGETHLASIPVAGFDPRGHDLPRLALTSDLAPIRFSLRRVARGFFRSLRARRRDRRRERKWKMRRAEGALAQQRRAS